MSTALTTTHSNGAAALTDTPPTKLYIALLAAMRGFGPVFKNTLNPHLKSKYADLGAVLDTIEGPLWENGLLVVQRFQPFQDGLGIPILVTELIHAASGERLTSEVVVVSKDPNDPQKVGAAITYYRRYSLLALLGLAPEDDDGHSASQPRRQDDYAGSQAPYQKRGDDRTPPRNQPIQATSASQANGSSQTHAYRDIPPQPAYAPQRAVAAEVAARAAEPFSPPQYELMLNDAWVAVEDGKTKGDIWLFITSHRARLTEAQWSDINATHWKQMCKKLAERDSAALAGTLAPAHEVS